MADRTMTLARRPLHAPDGRYSRTSKRQNYDSVIDKHCCVDNSVNNMPSNNNQLGLFSQTVITAEVGANSGFIQISISKLFFCM